MGRRSHQPAYNPVLSRGIVAIVLVVVAIIFSLSFFAQAGAVGVILDQYVLSFLFGSMRYATPVMILILAWFLIKDIDYNYRATHAIGAFLFFISMSGLFHIGFETKEMWQQALNGIGGGIFGMFAWVLKSYLGPIAGTVILIGMTAISVFLLFNTALTAFIMFNKKMILGFGVLGKWLLNLFGLFVKKDSKLKVAGNYEEEDDENEEEDDDEDIGRVIKNIVQEGPISGGEDGEVKRKFFVKKVGDNEEEDSSVEVQEKEKSKSATPWDKPVLIKNLPPNSLLTTKQTKPTSGDINANAETIHNMLHEFNIEVEMGEVRVGPTVTQYSLKPDKGVKLSRITSLSNDLSLALAAHPIRIEAPIPGKSLVGIEVPNTKVAMVSLKELLESKEFSNRSHNLMIALGKDVAGKVWFADLPKMPHLLVAGATGSGKTVCINTIILSLLYQNTAESLRFIMVDPKRVELTLYNGIPHLLTPVITNAAKTVNALKWTIGEMDRRFEMLSQDQSRDIDSYNKKHPEAKIPRIIFVIDELADLMAMAASEVEAGIIRLAQMARAVGIHLIVATQRPSVDVITGLMKANIPARIAFSVASIIDSRTILDCPGAEKLLGRGDMLILTQEMSKPVRLQGAFVSEEEVKNVAEYLKEDGEAEYDDSIVEKAGANASGTMNLFGGSSDDQDPLFFEAKAEIIKAGKASASFLQRRFKVGYARAARILDELEAAGVIGPADGAKAREILATDNDVDVEEIETSDGAGQELNVFDKEEGDKGTEVSEDEIVNNNEENLS